MLKKKADSLCKQTNKQRQTAKNGRGCHLLAESGKSSRISILVSSLLRVVRDGRDEATPFWGQGKGDETKQKHQEIK